ncbi:SDR family oxidoreductase [Mycolicibacter icosiumassiliensis]|uniref:SDR family oxidoreductase n=1 Tax=Mycolicibacter icosiumassiliensis TaxID=1792835 RepID=UPI000A553F14|nr:SDR family oxidoreductase [Mycolicibacter icosiumassiliensis]
MDGFSKPSVAVTGATGYIGGEVARHLAAAGLPQLLLARTPSRAPKLPGAKAVECSYGDREASHAALSGITTLFMVSASESAERLEQHRTFIDSAARARVRHVVYTSFVGARPDATFTLARDHYFTEEHIIKSGMTYTFLRDNFYIDFLSGLAGDDGVIRGPAGDGRVAAVARKDVALVGATVMKAPEKHTNRTYELTGAEALSLAEIAGILSEHTGRAVRYHDETIAEAYRSRQRWNAPSWQLDAWVSTYAAIAAGELATVTTDVATITGHPPTSFVKYLESVEP